MKREIKKYIGICLYGSVCSAAGLLWQNGLAVMVLAHGVLAVLYGLGQLVNIAFTGTAVSNGDGPKKKRAKRITGWPVQAYHKSVGTWGGFR